jgi:hypothetical protein
MKPATVKYILFEYLYRVIDDEYIFEYDWTNDTWWFCKGSTMLVLLPGEEISEEDAIVKAEEFRKNLKDEPYVRKYALSKYFQI